jgi:hypothetical protein
MPDRLLTIVFHMGQKRKIYIRCVFSSSMEKTTTERTVDYIKEHPYIKHCLKRGLINYSSLARMISSDLGIEKTSSKEAILVAARRFKERLTEETHYEEKIRTLLKRSELEVKNKIVVIILARDLDMGAIEDIQQKVHKNNGTFYLLEGSDNYTIITQERYKEQIEKAVPTIIKTNMGLAMITLKSPKEIETIHGVVAFLTSLFAENEVNLLEFLSCWTDTLFVINTKDIKKSLEFLDF